MDHFGKFSNIFMFFSWWTPVTSTNTSHYSNATTPEANKIVSVHDFKQKYCIMNIIVKISNSNYLVIKKKVPKDDTLPVTVVSILLILLAFGTAVYLICEYIYVTSNTSVVLSMLI